MRSISSRIALTSDAFVVLAHNSLQPLKASIAERGMLDQPSHNFAELLALFFDAIQAACAVPVGHALSYTIGSS
jgi:hypothetical protein